MATLDELDAFGNMDALDSFGTLEQLDNLVLHSASGAVSIAVTTTGGATRIQQASGTPSIAITATSTSNSLLDVVGTATISITESSAATRIQTASSTSELAITTSASSLLILVPTFLPTNIVITADDNILSLRQDASASVDITMTAGISGEVLGESWTIIPSGNETWSTLQ